MRRLGYRESLMAFVANYAPQGGRICKKSTSSRRHQAQWPTFASVKPNGFGRRRDKK